MTLGEAMRRTRIRHGLTVKEMSEKTGICEASIRGIEKDRQVPNILFVEAMADVLGVSIDVYIDHKVKERNR